MKFKPFVSVVCLALVVLVQLAAGTEWIVGDKSGWSINEVNYTKWAEDKVFQVGDTLLFKYDPDNHDVVKVNQLEFQTCTVPANGALKSGHDLITLATPGKKWYICGQGTHCKEFQQKLVINVEALLAAPAPAPSGSGRLQGSQYLFVIATAAAVSVFF